MMFNCFEFRPNRTLLSLLTQLHFPSFFYSIPLKEWLNLHGFSWSLGLHWNLVALPSFRNRWWQEIIRRVLDQCKNPWQQQEFFRFFFEGGDHDFETSKIRNPRSTPWKTIQGTLFHTKLFHNVVDTLEWYFKGSRISKWWATKRLVCSYCLPCIYWCYTNKGDGNKRNQSHKIYQKKYLFV